MTRTTALILSLVAASVGAPTAAAAGGELRLRAALRLESAAAAPAAVAINDLLERPLNGAWADCADRRREIGARTVALGRLWIETRLRECGAARWRWSGPMSTRLSRAGAPLSASPREAVEAALIAAYAVDGRPAPSLDDATLAALPAGEAGVGYRASLPPGLGGGGVPVSAWLRIEAWRDGELLRRDGWQARLRRMAPAWVATRAMAPGEALTAEDFERRNVDVAGWPETIDAQAPWPDGWRVRGRIAAGAPLMRTRMARRPEVAGGEPVLATATAGQVTLSVPATALQDGQAGAWVRVRLPGRSDTVMARVQADGQVEVK